MNSTILILISLIVLVLPILAVVLLARRVSNSMEIIKIDPSWVRCDMEATYTNKQARYGEHILIAFYDQADEVVHQLDLERWGIGQIEGLKRQLLFEGWELLSEAAIPTDEGEQWGATFQRLDSPT